MAPLELTLPLTRKVLTSVLKINSEFDAFCLDYFPEVYRLISSGMDRLQKENLLLSVEKDRAALIIEKLCEFKPQAKLTVAHLLGQNNEAIVADDEEGAVSETSGSLLMDNWLLQDAGSFLKGSLITAPAAELVIRASTSEHVWHTLPRAVVQIESVIALISEIVLRERLLVDAGWAHAWRGKLAIETLVESKVVLPAKFANNDSVLSMLRSSMVDDICITDSMRAVQRANEQAWAHSERVVDGFASQMFWGTAGYLARADILQIPYSGHPLRRDLLLATTLARSTPDASSSLHTWVDTVRIKLTQQLLPLDMKNSAVFLLPPVAVEIIESCDTIDRLVATALQLRDEYKPLRSWISRYQQAISERDPQSLFKHRQDLLAVANEIETKYQQSDYGHTVLDLNTRYLNQSTPACTKIGVRTLISKMVQTKLGDQIFRKLLKMIGEESSRLGHNTLQCLQKRSMRMLETARSP